MKIRSTCRITGSDQQLLILVLFVALLAMMVAPVARAEINCGTDTITAKVAVLDNPTIFNRLGAQNPNWLTYSLLRDVVHNQRSTAAPPGTPCALPDGTLTGCQAGAVEQRHDKRPRPLVMRSVAGSCLSVEFHNLLAPVANPNNAIQDALFNDDQVADRCASFHASGTELLNDMADDGSFVGNNDAAADINACVAGGNSKSGVIPPGAVHTYNLHTPHEGAFVISSYGATIGSEASSGTLGMGLFGILNVEPVGAKMYRSQLTEEEMRLATVGTVPSDCTGAPGEVSGVDCNPGGQPIIDYEAVYPAVEADGVTPTIWVAEGKAGLPIVNMLTAAREYVHSDINAIIAGSNPDGSFPPSTYPLEGAGKKNPMVPNRLEPFREFSSVYHDEQTNSQVFPRWYFNPVLLHTLIGVKDQFMINYGSGGIGSEIIANRLHTGPMHDCTDCAYEEFFLSSQTVGDPGMLVDVPANFGIEQCDPTAIAGPTCWRDPVNLANGPIDGNFALYQEDPANVHHAYTGDFVKIRNIHAGAFEQHIFHLHNHQWLFNPNDDNSNYLDAQEIFPGSGHTYELVNGGAGNRNKTAGDAIFHCHFYPHFAQGMWYHIRNHDVMETGTVLAVSGGTVDNPGIHATPFALRSGQPMAGSRALPDGELPDGSPIPALVPLPSKAMPQMPAKVSVAAVDRGSHSILGGRAGPDGVFDSSQAVVDRVSVAGADGVVGTADDLSPGFPFWLAGVDCGEGVLLDANGDVVEGCDQGIVGQRMPTPPLDMLTEDGAAVLASNAQVPGADPLFENVVPDQAGGWDGGLPRHALLGYVSGGLSADTQSRLDFRKVVEMAMPVFFPETGTDLEQVSMRYQSVRHRPSMAIGLDGVQTAASFVLNGAPPVPGGAYQDPCIDDNGNILENGVEGLWFNGVLGDDLNQGGFSVFDSKNPRTYKVANVQIDAVFNKVGHHYPQERIIALWGDVEPSITKQRPPQPLVMRFNTFDCGKIQHTNVVPHEFELDDFQVRTPTDIIGQHIHLPKWDLTTGDGAANGWNYEDGSLSPGIVQERIHAINEFNALAGTVVAAGTLPGQLAPIDLSDLAPVATIATGDDGSDVVPGTTHLEALPHPFFGAGVAGQDHLGARTVIQRILVDPIVNADGIDRGLGLTFSHDHYGPSTFQQIGLYSTILAEPAGSVWRHNETGEQLGADTPASPARVLGNGLGTDGGPTHWAAAILPPADSTVPQHREFYYEMSDFQHAYEAGTYVGADASGVPMQTNIIQPDPFNAAQATAPALANTWETTVNPPLKLKSVPFPDVVTAEAVCPGTVFNADGTIAVGGLVPRPCPEAINISHSSMWVVNYRNEPVGLRVFDPNGVGPDGQNGTQTAGRAGDLAFAFQSRNDRAIPELNTSFGNTPYPQAAHCQGPDGDGINCDRNPGDPFTPIMRAYERDHVKIKIQVGATEEQHQSTIHGLKWLSNGSGFGRAPNSGWRNFQSHGISEQFSLQLPLNPDPGQLGNTVDYLYAQDATRDGNWLGTWGILRSYGNPRQDLFELPDNPQAGPLIITNAENFDGVCPRVLNPRNGRPTNEIANLRTYDVTVALANDILPNNLGVTIPPNTQIDLDGDGVFEGGDSDGDGIADNVGGPLNVTGGTLVYNRRGTVVPDVFVPAEGAEPAQNLVGGSGPLNDPTAIMYVMTSDLDPVTGMLLDTAPVEPLVLRANADDCIEVTLRNRLPADTPVIDPGPDGILGDDPATPLVNEAADDILLGFNPGMPDLAGWQDMMWVVKRNIQPDPVTGLPQMHFFNNNLVRPSNYAGLHAQLVEYDSSRDDGLVVGGNSSGVALAAPGGQKTFRWYAGDIQHRKVFGGNPNQRRFEIVTTPVEFGASNLVSADRVKQPQKGAFGALVIEPAFATYDETRLVPDGQGSGAATRLTRAQATITSDPGLAGSGGTYDEGLAIGHKITNLRWADGSAIANVNQLELGREGAEDSGHAGFNYGMEPSWFRFKLPPDVPFGNAGTPNSFGSLPNAHALYANNLVVGEPNAVPAIAGVSAAGDPATPVFRATAGQPARIHVLNGASADRDGVFILHGHVWQRDPFVCPDSSKYTLEGLCEYDIDDPDRGFNPPASTALGINPLGKYMGGEEGMGHVFGHWPILLESAGGGNEITGDYLFRDYAPNGNRNGQFGIMRVE